MEQLRWRGATEQEDMTIDHVRERFAERVVEQRAGRGGRAGDARARRKPLVASQERFGGRQRRSASPAPARGMHGSPRVGAAAPACEDRAPDRHAEEGDE
jgi:hypothetical protein